MQKNNKGYLLAFLILFSSSSHSQEVDAPAISSNSFEYLSTKAIYEQDKFNFIDTNAYIGNEEKEKKMKKLSYYISARYKVELDTADTIVRTSFTESEKHNIDPLTVLSIMGVESTYNPFARSHKGAIGLTQIMPRYHRAKISALKKDDLDIFSIKGNIIVGIQIIKEYLSLANGNIQSALQMYNGSTNDKKKTYSTKVLKKRTTLYEAFNL
jgi:soluble lytic murein transglycosylase-like protein